MKLEFLAVPDYECSGVVEHYTKVSILVSSDALVPIAVCSVIVNKKTGNVQHQVKVDKLDARHIRIAMFGYGKNVKSYCTLDQIANDYANLTDNEKKNLRTCFAGLTRSVYMAFRKIPLIQGNALSLLKNYADTLAKAYADIQQSTYENTILPSVNSPAVEADTEPSAENTQENTPAVEEAAPIERHTKKVARLVFANGLTEFLNGNLYDIEIAESGLPNKIEANGHTYYSVLNANGEPRYLDASRISIEEQFTEPPTA